MSELWYGIKGKTLTALADAVRSKVGNTGKMTPSEMAATIEALNIPSAAIILSVSSVDELPTDAEDGTIAIIEGVT